MGKKAIHFDARIVFKCSSEQKKIIKEKANLAGRELSDYIRIVSTNKKLTSISDIQAVVQIRKIGANLNQIARKINRTYGIDKQDELISNIKKMQEDLDELKSVLQF